MKFVPLYSYEKIDQRTLRGGTAAAWISEQAEDTCWDSFLQQTPLGQFQQSAIWAAVKNLEGWRPVRVVLTLDDEIAGGFQILRRSSWWGGIGYVKKGPVLLPNYPWLAEYATELLQKVVRKKRLRALVVQPPDLCEGMSAGLARSGFEPNVLTHAYEATWIVDLKDGIEALERRMNKWTRKKIKQAINRSVTIREGEREDVRTFFELMLSTCQRQGVAPSPRNERMLLALWDAARPAGCIRLTFAEYERKPLAGLVCIVFGQTAYLWKKGWSSSDGLRHPNELLTYEMLRWANSRGYQFADFCAVDFGIAVTMLRGQPLSPEQETSRDVFNIRFGGSPRLMPEARVYFPNPMIRLAYRMAFRKKIQQKEAARSAYPRIFPLDSVNHQGEGTSASSSVE